MRVVVTSMGPPGSPQIELKLPGVPRVGDIILLDGTGLPDGTFVVTKVLWHEGTPPLIFVEPAG